jgi:hypothetical protein
VTGPARHPLARVTTLDAVRIRTLAISISVLALVLSACGGSSKPKSEPTVTSPNGKSQPTTAPGHVAKAAAADPSVSAKMVCEAEVVNKVAEVIGIKTTSISTPTWVNQVYSCDFVYPGNAKMTLKVKELSSVDATSAYYDQLAKDLGKKQDLQGLGEGAFSTKSGAVVTRKDYKVLVVDTSKLPAQFGVPPDTRENDAINVSFTIMECWVGA